MLNNERVMGCKFHFMLDFVYICRYALDWLSDEGLIRVMLGDKGQVVCSLTIESGYPATGSVKLTAVEGLQEQAQLDSFKVGNHLLVCCL